MKQIDVAIWEMEDSPGAVEAPITRMERDVRRRVWEVIVNYKAADGHTYAFRIDLPDGN